MLDMPGTSTRTLEAGWTELQGGALGTREGAVRAGGRLGRDAGGSRRAQLGCVVARRFGRRVRYAGARLPSVQGERRPRQRGTNGDVARGGPARLPRRLGGSERMAAARAPAAGLRSTRDPTTAGWRFTRDTSPTSAAMQTRRASSAFARPSSGGDSTSPTSRCSAWRFTGRRWCPRLRWRRACAASTKRLRRLSKATPRSPSRAPGPAVSSSPRARPCSTTTVRPSGATGSQTSQTGTEAATCSRSAGPSTAQCTSGGAAGRTRRRCSSRRSRTIPARARRGSGHRWSCSRT